LENLGYRVETANGVDEGLQKLDRFKPNLIFLDLMMDHYDSGFTFSHKAKTNPATSNTPIVMVTSVRRETSLDFDAKTNEEKQWIKVDEFLEKPLSPQEIASTAEKYLS
ncbi:MAG: response regulator, partial [Vulcanimicrobiota bacterium]